jgi:hypothetical protein
MTDGRTGDWLSRDTNSRHPMKLKVERRVTETWCVIDEDQEPSGLGHVEGQNIAYGRKRIRRCQNRGLTLPPGSAWGNPEVCPPPVAGRRAPCVTSDGVVSAGIARVGFR